MMKKELPRSEYPRPRLVRSPDTWQCLNGEWDFEFDREMKLCETDLQSGRTMSLKITVPFAPESKLSGIGDTDFSRCVWYRRNFTPEIPTENRRIFIRFGAVDYHASLWLNGAFVGEHFGGYTPFSFDITDRLKSGENTVILKAEDDTADPLQPSGKQSTKKDNYGCFYTRSTGVWQTVWLESVPETFVKLVKTVPDPENEKVNVTVIFDGNVLPKNLHAEASFEGKQVSASKIKISSHAVTFEMEIKSPILWDIGKGALYDLRITAGEDSVSAYFGMRSVAVEKNRFLLNGRSIFQRLILDQGYYEDGIYTAPTDEDLKRDIELTMSAGFNGARMHMKIFEERWIYHADKMGYLIWSEYPNWGLDTLMEGAYKAMIPEWTEALERDFSSPSVIGLCPLNETWTPDAHRFTEDIYRLTKRLDPTRPVIDVSGFYHSKKSDIFDVHDYEQDPKVFASRYADIEGGRSFQSGNGTAVYDGSIPFFVSEFGGTMWDCGDGNSTGWGYGDRPESEEDLLCRFEGLCRALLENPAVMGFCYTQFTDVMQEKNGLFTFNREPKFDLERIRATVTRKAAIEDDPDR